MGNTVSSETTIPCTFPKEEGETHKTPFTGANNETEPRTIKEPVIPPSPRAMPSIFEILRTKNQPEVKEGKQPNMPGGTWNIANEHNNLPGGLREQSQAECDTELTMEEVKALMREIAETTATKNSSYPLQIVLRKLWASNVPRSPDISTLLIRMMEALNRHPDWLVRSRSAENLLRLKELQSSQFPNTFTMDKATGRLRAPQFVFPGLAAPNSPSPLMVFGTPIPITAGPDQTSTSPSNGLPHIVTPYVDATATNPGIGPNRPLVTNAPLNLPKPLDVQDTTPERGFGQNIFGTKHQGGDFSTEQTAAQGFGLFGQNQPSQNILGTEYQVGDSSTNQTAAQGFGLFGQNKPSQNIFGTKHQVGDPSTNQTAAQGLGLFGQNRPSGIQGQSLFTQNADNGHALFSTTAGAKTSTPIDKDRESFKWPEDYFAYAETVVGLSDGLEPVKEDLLTLYDAVTTSASKRKIVSQAEVLKKALMPVQTYARINNTKWQETVKNRDEAITKLRSLKDIIQEELKVCRTQLTSHTASYEDLRSMIDRQRVTDLKIVQDLEADVKTKEAELARQDRKFQMDLEMRRLAGLDQQAKLQAKHREKISEANKEKDRALSELKSKLQAQVDAANAKSLQYGRLNARIDELERQLKTSDQDKLDLNLTKAALEKEISDMKGDLSRLTDFENGYDQVKAELAQLQADYEDLRAERDELLAKLQASETRSKDTGHQRTGSSSTSPSPASAHEVDGEHLQGMEEYWKNRLKSKVEALEKKREEIVRVDAEISKHQKFWQPNAASFGVPAARNVTILTKESPGVRTDRSRAQQNAGSLT